VTSPIIVHHGAVDGVTGSCHELVIDENHSVLVDCGLFQGAETAAEGTNARRLEVEFDVDRVRALLVTHCHVDHVGRIPYLIAAGFRGPILCTEPTAVLLPLMIEDAVRVGGVHEPRHVERLIELIRARTLALPYGKWIPVPQVRVDDRETLRVRFQPAGHILGSAYVECDVTVPRASPPSDAAAGRATPDVPVAGTVDPPTPQAPPGAPAGGARRRARPERARVLFSGDLGGPYTPLLPSPKPPFATDVLVLEATYGDRIHEDRQGRRARLKELVERCLANHGAILIPAFSIGRTQELLYELEDIIHRHRQARARPRSGAPGREGEGGSRADGPIAAIDWSTLPVIVDSPLAARFNQAYLKLRGHWDAEAKRTLRKGRHPLSFEQVVTVDSHEDHLKVLRHLKETARPAIVLAGSGMCSGGRIVDYLKALLGDARTDVVFVGYQAEGTPGRAIQTYGPKGGWVELDGERYDIRAGVHTLSGYSAHADQAALLGFVKRMRRRPREIRLVHGSETAKATLKTRLAALCPDAHVWIP
jgi:metallo-beta-lactamase family protein